MLSGGLFSSASVIGAGEKLTEEFSVVAGTLLLARLFLVHRYSEHAAAGTPADAPAMLLSFQRHAQSLQ